MNSQSSNKENTKKKFWERFKEFLMMFLAITLSFFAQGIRETMNAKSSAKEFLQSYENELLQQKNQMEKFRAIFKRKLIDCDSIVNIYYEKEENKKLDILSRLIIPAKTIVDLPIITSAYDQMVYSGTLRDISNPPLREKMAYYKFKIEDIQSFNSHIIQALLNMASEVGKLEDLHDFVTTNSAYAFDYTHIPKMKAFGSMTNEQRRLLINYYVGYKVQASANLGALNELSVANSELIHTVNTELNK